MWTPGTKVRTSSVEPVLNPCRTGQTLSQNQSPPPSNGARSQQSHRRHTRPLNTLVRCCSAPELPRRDPVTAMAQVETDIVQHPTDANTNGKTPTDLRTEIQRRAPFRLAPEDSHLEQATEVVPLVILSVTSAFGTPPTPAGRPSTKRRPCCRPNPERRRRLGGRNLV